eukprot:3604577-Rhodomonas_salina.5
MLAYDIVIECCPVLTYATVLRIPYALSSTAIGSCAYGSPTRCPVLRCATTSTVCTKIVYGTMHVGTERGYLLPGCAAHWHVIDLLLLRYHPLSSCAPYEMSGTDVCYGPTRALRDTGCPVLMCAIVQSVLYGKSGTGLGCAAAHLCYRPTRATRCPVLTWSMVLAGDQSAADTVTSASAIRLRVALSQRSTDRRA